MHSKISCVMLLITSGSDAKHKPCGTGVPQCASPRRLTPLKERENPLKELLSKLKLEDAVYDGNMRELSIPFTFKLKHGSFKARVCIPSSLEWHKALLYALKKEQQDD